MITTEFAVDEKKSFIKSLGWPDVKPGVKLPLIVPLSAGGKISLTIDGKNSTIGGYGSDLQFITDQFLPHAKYNITGKLQPISVHLTGLDLVFDPRTGNILSGGGRTFLMGEPQQGCGSLMIENIGPSSLLDGNNFSFNITDGLGCKGGLVFEFATNPADFFIHIEATVVKEDADGDGNFETICSSGVWKKKLNLLYDPPKIRIVVPTHDLVRHWLYAIDVMHTIRFTDFLKNVENWPGSGKEQPVIESIELVGAPDLWCMLFDSYGIVYSGNLSDVGTKVIRMPSVNIENLRIGIMPNPGMSMDH